MNPDEKTLLERVAKLSEENNRILHKIQSAARWARVWGFVKLLIVVIPLVLGYIYLVPYIEVVRENFSVLKDLLPVLDAIPQ